MPIRMSRSISVFGLGYAGTVTAACFAHMGHNVIGVDLSPPKIEAIETGRRDRRGRVAKGCG